MIIGVVGKANVGKSTFYKAATMAEVDIGNYPFTTIRPNSGVGYVRVKAVCREFDVKCSPKEGFCREGTRYVPVNLIDVAGLVPGAHEGKGMGNQFLDDLRQADVLIHVIDVSGSTNESGEPVEKGSYDPADDIKFLEEELDMWYLGIIKKGWERFARQVMQEKKQIQPALAKQLSGLKITEEHIISSINRLEMNTEKPTEWSEDELKKLAGELRRLTKPMIIACNKIDILGADENFERLKKEFPDHILVRCSSVSELALREAAKKELIRYLPGSSTFEISKEEGLNEKQVHGLNFIRTTMLDKHSSTGVQDVLDKAVYSLLGYIALFPVAEKLADQSGNILPDCFLLPKGTTAIDFAYHLHTDFGDKFIRAIDVRKKITIGKEHALNHRDVVEIVSDR